MQLYKLKKEQEKLSKKILLKDVFSEIKLVGGITQTQIGEKILCQIIIMDADTGKIVDKSHAFARPKMNYIPGFLSYREGPVIIDAYNKLKKKPDLMFIKGNGILHPRKMGVASYVGLITDKPTIGISKKIILGDDEEENKGKIISKGTHVGYSFITRKHANPIYISPGHKISLKSTEKITKKFCFGSKLPEPLQLAHKISLKTKKKISEEEKQNYQE